ncbi:transcription factor A, mitochondrial-like [Engraulis encrasicolus]|uniref:transcription factor A, mitochondrial-like n=1 Tax=Engraulis encrasicolus TaxID=184585 RepID=UPI002FD49B24
MAPLSLVAAGVNVLTKSFSLFSSASLARCSCAFTAAKPFSTSAGGPPKRPLTGYLRFAQEQRPQVLRQHPDFKANEVIKKIAERWRLLSPDQKRPFENAALVERNQYKLTMERYKEQLTPAQSLALEEEKRERRAKRKAIKKKRELTTLGKPKRPRLPFNIFMSEHFEEARGVTVAAKLKSLQEDWGKLSIMQKQVYVQLAEDDKVRYKNEMKTWEEHMLEIGRQDLIRIRERPARKTSKAGKRTKSKVTTKSKKTAAKKKPTAKKKTTAKKTTRTTKKA